MDIMLERILSLIPKKENGSFKHGALSEFARPLGFKDGHIISDWISGNSESYKNYIYQISALHHVSVEWLRGETDDPGAKKAHSAIDEVRYSGLTDKEKQVLTLFRQIPESEWDNMLLAVEVALRSKGLLK